jgi:hypothetical protein
MKINSMNPAHKGKKHAGKKPLTTVKSMMRGTRNNSALKEALS